MTRRLLSAGSAAALAVGLFTSGACGSEPGSPAGGRGDVPITQRAIAVVALDHLPDRPNHLQATWTDRRSPRGLLGADLRYGYGGEDDGDLVRITISPEVTPHPCRGEGPDGCARLSADAGGTAYLLWDRVEPEEDPGYVAVVLQREDEQVVALTAGETIRKDPREQRNLRVPVATLEELVRDDRLHLEVTQDVVDAGERLEGWSGQEPDPHAYDLRPATDYALAVAYPFLNGGYAYYSRPRSSPLKADFGEGAVGGRVRRGGDGEPSRTMDVLASRTGPSWLADDPCATPAFAGHCTETQGKRGPRYLAWVPGSAADGAVVWGFQRRAHQVVGIRLSGFRVPESRHWVKARAEWFLVRRVLGHRTVGVRVEKRLLDFDLEAAQDAGS